MTNQWLDTYLTERVRLINEHLEGYLPALDTFPTTIHKAMHYCLMGGGKRLRPILVLAAAEAVGGDIQPAIPAACAIEMIHAYSLVHDDLPAMDNDDFRRGRPTCHKVFGEALAILTGDALLTLAFEILAGKNQQAGLTEGCSLDVIKEIASAAGTMGLIGGQVVDIESEGKEVSGEVLQYIHSHKTGSLFKTCVRVGGITGGAGPQQLHHLTSFAESFGMAFQITDDILNVEGDTVILGKGVGTDASRGKVTYPSLYGLSSAKKLAQEAVDAALASLASFDSAADPLRNITLSLIARKQ